MSEAFHFARPWLLAAMALLPLYGLWRWRRERRRSLPFAPLQYRSAPGRRRWLAGLILPLELLLLAAAVAGLAGPYRTTRLELVEDEGVDVLLVLDISLSMLAEDFPPNRLEALRAIARDFIARSGGNRLGLVVFAKDAFVQTPLTTDHAVMLELLEGVTVYAIDQAKSGGTAIGDALLVAAERLQRSKVEGRDQALVLITDGESNLGIDPVLAARYLAEQGARFYAIGVGGTEPVEVFFEGERVGGDDPYLAVLDDSQLRAMAQAAGGRFFRATDVGALEEIFAELSRLESAPLETRTLETRESFTAGVALGVLSLFTAHLLLGGVLARRPYR